ncbi:hypothetical protein [Legionella longbeachae]|uniref:Uncharacterized protein n=1 Tax=Legionella longbeachae serogroup 1 (strain NSW150) TaxID=661367 RepID=D3HLX1_LEGLN|nr:hypothetical protein [Legionella longbeachae]VEE03880.1 Uncharacterised protein [Legionella oakridgensis]HBD7397338.1 hypothetical protein [Legionella pneumophila]ARB93262.1 hypothetical protein A6J40_14235 [Legionella longbeachae]ARM33674.1 hypothetical protein B0B39_09105 [Legionella longbeachae]EEZ93389.1 hypothetical protein LLB_3819 [Legionella longbeachae D-4968]
MKRKHELSKYEQHYYKEISKKIVLIKNEDEQRKIDRYMEKHTTNPPRTTRESGYSAYLFKGKKIDVNSSMVKKRKIDKDHLLITRLNKAPTLPISCLASTEHVIAMQDGVDDFESELEPKTKQNVMYLIQLKCHAKKMNVQREKKALLYLLHEYDDTLSKNNVSILYNKEKAVFEIKVSTQVADIQLLVRALTSKKKFNIINCDFEDIGLNQGVCLVKKDASNPIHALVNIANSESEKGFLERDAGTTTGLYTASYQDRNWTFNFFSSLEHMREKTEYPKDSFAIKLFNAN